MGRRLKKLGHALDVGPNPDACSIYTRALELQPFTLKPLLRRAMAYESLERYHKAYVDYKTVLQIDVGVQAAHDSIHRYRAIQSPLAWEGLTLAL